MSVTKTLKRKPQLFSEAPVIKKSKKSLTSRQKIPEVKELDFSSTAKNKNGLPWNFKIASWNVNGIRAWCEKNGFSYVSYEDPDVICFQETKCDVKSIPAEAKLKGYHWYWNSGSKAGYSGTGLGSKVKPLKVTYGINNKEHDNEGRVITAEYDNFFIVTAYIPNSGSGLVRLDYRVKEWDVCFHDYLVTLETKKPIILLGDLNVSYLEIDLANPKSNEKNAGFTKEERKSFGDLLNSNFVDLFRHFYPKVTGVYSYWSYMGGARTKNIGWRLDYTMLSRGLLDNACDSLMRKDVFGSDHCPIVLLMAF